MRKLALFTGFVILSAFFTGQAAVHLQSKQHDECEKLANLCRHLLKDEERISRGERLGVLWTSADPEVAEKVCLMYTHAAHLNRWFDDVVLIVWGPSSLLLSQNASLQNKIRAMISDGVTVQACIVCADSYGVTQDLRDLGIEVKGMGARETDMIKSGWKMLTF